MLTFMLVWIVIAVPSILISYKNQNNAWLSGLMIMIAIFFGMFASFTATKYVDSILPKMTEVETFPLVKMFVVDGREIFVKEIEVSGNTHYLYKAFENSVPTEKTVSVDDGSVNVQIKEDVINPRLEITSVQFERQWLSVIFGKGEIWRQYNFVFYVPSDGTDLESK